MTLNRRTPWAKAMLYIIGLAILSMIACAPTSAEPIRGIGIAKDGDSLYVGQREVRLHGIDAPEFDQLCTKSGQQWQCGKEARDQLSKLVTGKEVKCVSMGEDQYGRLLGECSTVGVDVNRTMVATGYAVAFRSFSTAYLSAEDSAKVNRCSLRVRRS